MVLKRGWKKQQNGTKHLKTKQYIKHETGEAIPDKHLHEDSWEWNMGSHLHSFYTGTSPPWTPRDIYTAPSLSSPHTSLHFHRGKGCTDRRGLSPCTAAPCTLPHRCTSRHPPLHDMIPATHTVNKINARTSVPRFACDNTNTKIHFLCRVIMIF